MWRHRWRPHRAGTKGSPRSIAAPVPSQQPPTPEVTTAKPTENPPQCRCPVHRTSAPQTAGPCPERFCTQEKVTHRVGLTPSLQTACPVSLCAPRTPSRTWHTTGLHELLLFQRARVSTAPPVLSRGQAEAIHVPVQVTYRCKTPMYPYQAMCRTHARTHLDPGGCTGMGHIHTHTHAPGPG